MHMNVTQSGDWISGRCGLGAPLVVSLFVLLTVLFLVGPAVAQTVTFTELYPFNSNGNLSDGAWPEAGVTRDAAGNLYGTTFFGAQARGVTSTSVAADRSSSSTPVVQKPCCTVLAVYPMDRTPRQE
jgi:hypothetical protein